MHFTVEFRRKMAELPLRDRREWLASLAARAREATHGLHISQEMREVARGCRLPLVDSIQAQLGPFDPLLLRAVLEVPRERHRTAMGRGGRGQRLVRQGLRAA